MYVIIIESICYILLILIIHLINTHNEVGVYHIGSYVMLFSLYASIILYYSTISKAESEYREFAKIIANERDLELEASMKDIIEAIKANERVKKFYSKILDLPINTIEKDIESKYLTPIFFRRYEYVVSFYDADYNPYKKEPLNYNEYRKIIQSSSTIIVNEDQNIYFCPIENERYSYIVKIEILDVHDNFSGYILIQLKPIDKQINSDIFADMLAVSKSRVERFSEKNEVALYKQDICVWSTKNNILLGQLPSIDIKPEEFKKRVVNHKDVLSYSNKDGHIAMVVCKEYGLKYMLNIGVFILCISLFSILIIWIILLGVFYYFKNIEFFTWKQKHTLTANIQLMMTTLLLFSLIVISYITVDNFNEENFSHYKEDLIKKLELSSHFVTKEYIANQRENKFTFDVLGLQKLTQFNVHIYDKNGLLDRASGENIFDKSWLGRQMNPRALHDLNIFKTSVFIENESIANLSYLSAYIPLNKDNIIIGYLNFLFNIEALSENEKEKDDDFLGSLLLTYAIIILFAFFLSIVISNTITKKLRNISNRLKNVSLNQKNELLQISGSQEISELIKHYNQMIVDLEHNKKTLEKTQRESAWRDMAKQVAHEIKNPLTPMKLKIQMLERLMKSDPQKAQAKFEHLSKGIVEQIDNLAAIASEFSNFAQMPPPNNEVFEINELAETTVHLFQDTEYYHISFKPNEKPIDVYADKGQILRVFNNLIKNATQAIDDDRQGLIHVIINYTEDKVLINVTDNGIGISDEAQSKIFSPYFTSKSSGTGIGLYMCKNIIMNAHGAIYFKSIEGEGSTFTVELPIYKA